MSLLRCEMVVETVTFAGSGAGEGYEYPEKSGYGNNVDVVMEIHNVEDPVNSTTIKIGNDLFVRADLENILAEHSKYLESLKVFHGVDDRKDYTKKINEKIDTIYRGIV